jgi:hypothetical protein
MAASWGRGRTSRGAEARQPFLSSSEMRAARLWSAVERPHPVGTPRRDCMDSLAAPAHHAPVRVLTHIKKLDDALGHFRVRITCKCGATRECEPEVLARLCGPSASLASIAKRMRCSKCGTKGAEVVATPVPRPRNRR